MIALLGEALSGYFYFHGAMGAFLKQLDRREEVRISFDWAIALAGTAAEAAYIRSQLDGLAQPSQEARASGRWPVPVDLVTSARVGPTRP